jgi:hypothetical protein
MSDAAAADDQLAVRPEQFLSHWRQIRDSKEDAADGAMSVARAKKAAKRDGVDLDVLSLVEKLKNMDEDQRPGFLKMAVMYCQWLELPLGAFSLGIQAPAPKETSRTDFKRWQAGEDGHKHAMGGGGREANPHRPGSEEHQAWDRKWNVGFKLHQKKLAGQMARGASRKKAEAGEAGEADNVTRLPAGKMAAAGEGQEAAPLH